MDRVGSISFFTIFAFLLTTMIIFDESFATSEVTLNPPDNAIQWASLEIQLDDPFKIGTVKVKVIKPDGFPRDEIPSLQLLNDPSDPDTMFHGKIMLSNPGLVGSTPEILDNVTVQPGDTVKVSHDLIIWEEVTVVASGAFYPDGTRHEVTEKLYRDPGCTSDNDLDQICDEWELGNELRIDDGLGNFYSYSCINSCNSTTPDIFVELDWMEGHHPDPRAIKEVVEKFAIRNIALHLQIDEEFAIQHNNVIPFPGYEIPNMPQYNGFDQLKGNQFGTFGERAQFGTNPSAPNQGALIDAVRDLKHQVFHYGFLAHERLWEIGESGTGEVNGNDFMITLGSFSGFVGSADQQAGTLMHELGHNLGLLHGGVDIINYKPNYFSVMNHARQMPDFDADRNLDYSGEVLGHDHTPGELQEDNLIESPIGLDLYDESQEGIDHSNERIIYFCNGGAQAGLYYKTGDKVNWNCNTTWETSPTSGNINNFDNSSPPNEDLKGFDDWSNLNYFFVDSSDYEDGVHVNNGNGNAGADPREKYRNPQDLPPGLDRDHFRGQSDKKFSFVTEELELTIDNVISHRVAALLAITDQLAKIDESGFKNIKNISFEKTTSTTPKIILTQYIKPDDPSQKGLKLSVNAIEGSNTIGLSGHSDRTDIVITLRVIAPNGNMVSVDQISPNPDGTFAIDITTGGKLWTQDGAYTLSAQQEFSNYKAEVKIEIANGVVKPESDPFPKEDLESEIGEEAPETDDPKSLLFWGIEKSIKSTNYHDLIKTKNIVNVIDLGLKASLNDKNYDSISQHVDNLLASYESALDIRTTDFHYEGHKPVFEPIVDPEKVTEMINNVYEANGLNVCTAPFQGVVPHCSCPDGMIEENGSCSKPQDDDREIVCEEGFELIGDKCVEKPGKPWPIELIYLIIMMVAIIVLVLIVAFIPKRK